MRHLLHKLALSTAVLSGTVALAYADCQQNTVSKDYGSGSFQLAQSGGGGGSSGGGSGSSGGSSGGSGSTGGAAGTGTSGTGTGTTSPGSTSGNGSATVIPQNQPMRQPGTPGTPPQPNTTAPSANQPNR